MRYKNSQEKTNDRYYFLSHKLFIVIMRYDDLPDASYPVINNYYFLN